MRRLLRGGAGDRTLKRWLTATLAAFALCATGCEHHYFQAEGALSSDGGELGRWQAKPEGCSLAPADGLPVGQSSTVATFIWPDPLSRDRNREEHRALAHNVPLQLTVVRTATGIAAELTTMRPTDPIRLDASDCSTVTLSTQPGRPSFSGSRPTVAGRFRVDCEVQGSHVTGDIHFSGCEF